MHIIHVGASWQEPEINPSEKLPLPEQLRALESDTPQLSPSVLSQTHSEEDGSASVVVFQAYMKLERAPTDSLVALVSQLQYEHYTHYVLYVKCKSKDLPTSGRHYSACTSEETINSELKNYFTTIRRNSPTLKGENIDVVVKGIKK